MFHVKIQEVLYTDDKWIVTNNFTLGGIVRFKCSENYTMEGINKLTCLKNKRWNREIPKCLGEHFVINVFIMGYVTFSLGCYMVYCSVASLAVGYIYLSCSHLYSFASYDRPYALKIKYPVIRGFFYT